MKTELTLDWKHWLVGINWSSARLPDGAVRIVVLHLGPLSCMLSWAV